MNLGVVVKVKLIRWDHFVVKVRHAQPSVLWSSTMHLKTRCWCHLLTNVCITCVKHKVKKVIEVPQVKH